MRRYAIGLLSREAVPIFLGRSLRASESFHRPCKGQNILLRGDLRQGPTRLTNLKIRRCQREAKRRLDLYSLTVHPRPFACLDARDGILKDETLCALCLRFLDNIVFFEPNTPSQYLLRCDQEDVGARLPPPPFYSRRRGYNFLSKARSAWERVIIVCADDVLAEALHELREVLRLEVQVAPARPRSDRDGHFVRVQVLDEADGAWEGLHRRPDPVLRFVARLEVGVDCEREAREEGEKVLRGFALGWALDMSSD